MTGVSTRQRAQLHVSSFDEKNKRPISESAFLLKLLLFFRKEVVRIQFDPKVR